MSSLFTPMNDRANRPVKCVQLLGAPGCGKSTNLYGILFHLKKSGFPVEAVDEHDTKVHFHHKRPFDRFTQRAFFDRQRAKHVDYHAAEGSSVVTVTDSSPYLSYLHAAYYQPEDLDLINELREEALAFEEAYPGFVIFIRRPADVLYQTVGRFQTEAESSDFGAFQLLKVQADYADRHVVFLTHETELMVDAIKAILR